MICRTLNDRRHEATLVWLASIRLADLGRHDEAISVARRSVELLDALGDPRAAWYAEHLERYREGRPDSPAAVALTHPSKPGSGPTVLTMAMTALKAMRAFLGPSPRRVEPDLRRDRLATCEGCRHHTGLRCRLGGDFTADKTWLPHEGCPIGLWPDQKSKTP